MTCNNFGVSVNKKESDSSIFLTSQIEKKISDLKSEIDSKYLDETEANRIYVNEPISENIDMKNKKIINSGLPTDPTDLTNKQYVDQHVGQYLDNGFRQLHNKFIEKETLVYFQNKNEQTYATKAEMKKYAKKTDIGNYPFQNTKVDEMLTYYNIALTYIPKVWISAKFPFGLFQKLNIGNTMFSDIMGHKVYTETGDNRVIIAQNISRDRSEFLLNIEATKLSRITINIDFKVDFTFIFVAKKKDASDMGTIFTSSTANRVLGWRNQDKIFQVESAEISKQFSNNDTNLHCYIVRCKQNADNLGVPTGLADFWDLNDKIGSVWITQNFGKVIIGKPTEENNKGKGCFSELMLFDEALSDDALNSIRNFLFPKAKPKVTVVSQSVLENLS